ncbi:MAG: hypothetical protein K2X48_18375 [Chitinophagaceae bacterium]|nr:hypothetical protein [Chitinophagaceae bacterium]
MNYIRHLAGFFDRVAADERLNPTHISMYVSLFQFWNASRFKNPISISRGELMRVSKISAKATYHKCMKELNDFGYLKYKPSYNPFKGSLVYLFNFQTGSIAESEPPNLFNTETGVEQALVTHHTKIETGVEQAQEPYINSSNIINQTSLNLGKPAQKKEVQKMNGQGKKEKNSAKKERNVFAVPQLAQVQEYFASQKFPPVEAAKFYNYFQSNGWLVGGRTKMKDWKAAARNWMLNAKKYAGSKPVKPKAKHLHAKTNKNYSEPL